MLRKNRPLPIDRADIRADAGDMAIKAIAHIRSDFPEKFGIPRQSSLVPETKASIVFEEEYRQMRAIKGLKDFSHIWLIWQFSEALRDSWTPMVRPPRLGGNTYMGVFATRSPFRPNPLGLSCVRLENIINDPELGPVLSVCGADLMDGTPIYDIKPYIPYADCHPDASGSFAELAKERILKVELPEELMEKIPGEKRAAVTGILSQDPRPSYQNDPDRIYGVSFGGFDIKFRVKENVLTVVGVSPLK